MYVRSAVAIHVQEEVYRSRNDSDRGITDVNAINFVKLQCCGFSTTRDRAYPFPDAHNTANACIQRYGYTRPCASVLEALDHQVALTIFSALLVGMITKVPRSICLD
jgi:hypothetical protein